MSKKDSWVECNECGSEFKVVTEVVNMNQCGWCPFCGEPLPDDEDDIDEDY